MSQRGRRNYKPRQQNNNQINKEEASEQKNTDDIVKEPTAKIIEPEIEKETVIEKLQVVDQKPISTEEWIDEVIKLEPPSSTPIIINREKQKENRDEWLEEVIKHKPVQEEIVVVEEQPEKQIVEKKHETKKTTKVKESKEKTSKKAHYVFDRDIETGKINRKTVSENKKEVQTMKRDSKKDTGRKIKHLNALYEHNEDTIAKLEIEIEVHQLQRDKELVPEKIASLEAKIKNYTNSLEDMITRKKVLEELISKYQ
ncbi:gp691 [Bacillus phage G]|uniref:Gp691 n=1 Tax=Bacillus phage G TaxID=2884420 RepID=G3MB71_9CAUD|nr:gp691 [Bacillus phage G]AEO93934.1 gp691 [Bacillus phage G]